MPSSIPDIDGSECASLLPITISSTDWTTTASDDFFSFASGLALAANMLGSMPLLIAGNVPAKRWSKIRADAPGAAIAERLTVLALGDGAAAAVKP